MKKAILLVITLALVSCKKEDSKSYTELEKARWFIGEWEDISPEGRLSETWIVKNDSTFAAETYFITAETNDTIFSEIVDLMQSDNDLYYIPTFTDNQSNNGTEFKMTSATDDFLVFENPDNDFPKKITYKKVHQDSIVAEISGGGQPQTFPFKRVKK
jgi:hypothetical protein